MRDAAVATAEWWADKVFGPATGTSGDGMIDVLMLARPATQPPAGKRDEFTEALARNLSAKLDYIEETQATRSYPMSVTLSTDYSPEGVLSEIGQSLRIGGFPIKTVTWTYLDHLAVSLGYGAPAALAWSEDGYVQPPCGAGQYTDGPSFERLPFKCSAPKYHGRDAHVFDVPDPLCVVDYDDHRGMRRCNRPEKDDVHDLNGWMPNAHEFVGE